jgi:hypothetical protein
LFTDSAARSEGAAMKQQTDRIAPSRKLLIAGIVLIVIGAGVMDDAGRTQDALLWNIAGAFAFVGFLVSAISLFIAEGGALLPRALRRHHK